jgi:hypothetical protein
VADVRELPILMSAPMVRAILAGKKTQTRRIVSPPPSVKRFGRTAHFDRAWVDQGPSPAGNPGPYLKLPITGGDLADANDEVVERVYPRWFPGDRLWVRETWALSKGNGHRTLYRADFGTERWPPTVEWRSTSRWTPSIFMKRHYSRITLDVTRVRCESLQGISDDDVRAEGMNLDGIEPPFMRTFKALWNEINGKRPGCAWAFNPWVWVVEFSRVDQEARAAE